ncbi:MAG: NitT/TauT family transport system substrate-binding protein [Desulforhopalus sp.]|jgi:NitT/TauT family transport system substrate-binding protein
MGRKFSFLCMSLLLVTFVVPVSSFGGDNKAILRLALLPIPDVLPVYVALEKGYFKELGVTVEPLSVGSALERDQLMQAGKVDGMINEISGAANFNRDKTQVKIISVARSPIGDNPLFRILAAPGSGITTVAGLAGVPIGISKNTVIEYISTRLLTTGGLTNEEIEYKSIPVLPERLQLLLQGQIKAVTLPDPLGAAAIKAGAIEVVNDTDRRDVSASVITFSTDSLENKTDLVKKFMIAWEKAAQDLNQDPAAYEELMLKKIRVPKNIQGEFAIPPMPIKALPTKAQWDDVMAWMVERKLLAGPLVYEESVSSAFLPK